MSTEQNALCNPKFAIICLITNQVIETNIDQLEVQAAVTKASDLQLSKGYHRDRPTFRVIIL